MLKKLKKSLAGMNSTMLVLILIVLINALSYSMIMPLLYPYALKFNISKQAVGLLFAIFSFFQLIFTPIIGRLSDKFGRKPLLVISLFGSSLGLAIFGLASSLWMLFFARALDGVTGGNMSVAQAVISDLYAPKKRARLFGVLAGTWGTSFLIGPVVGGLLSRINLSVPFFFASILALVATFITLIFLPETHTSKKRLETKRISLKQIINFVHQPLVGGLLLVSFLSAAISNMIVIAIQIVGVDKFSLTPEYLSYIMVIMGLVQVFMQTYGIGWWLKRWPNKLNFIKFSLYLQTFALILISFLLNLWWFAFFLVIFQFGFSPMRPLTAGILSETSDQTIQGSVLGINQSALALGRTIGPIISGLMMATNFSLSFWVAAALLFIIAIIVHFLNKNYYQLRTTLPASSYPN